VIKKFIIVLLVIYHKKNFLRVQLGKLDDFIKTACLTSLTFLGPGRAKFFKINFLIILISNKKHNRK
jgi:hypothetical protein